MMFLLRRLDPETAHNLSLWLLTGWRGRVATTLLALITLAWALPLWGLLWLSRPPARRLLRRLDPSATEGDGIS